MLALLRQSSYAFALATAFLTAVLVYLYSKTTEKDPAQCTRAFYKTLVLGAMAGAAIAYATSPAQAAPAVDVGVEPFDAVPVGPNTLPPGI